MGKDKTHTGLTLFRWQSINPKINRYRFYSVSLGIDLWGQMFIVKHWGRIGTQGRRKFVWAAAEEMDRYVQGILRQREMHGYELSVSSATWSSRGYNGSSKP